MKIVSIKKIYYKTAQQEKMVKILVTINKKTGEITSKPLEGYDPTHHNIINVLPTGGRGAVMKNAPGRPGEGGGTLVLDRETPKHKEETPTKLTI